MIKSKIITRTILLVSLVSLCTDVASEMLYPVMPVYLKSIGFSVFLIGVLEGLAEFTAGISKGYFGNLSDSKRSRLPFIQWGYMLSAISKPLMVVFVYPLWIFFARTLDRLGKGVRTSARDALLSDETTPEHKAKVFGFHRALDTVGAAIGPVVALVYLYFYPGNYFWLFIIAFFPGLTAIALTFLIKEKKQTTTNSKERVNFISFLKYWKKSPVLYKRLVIGLLLFTLLNSSDAFLLLNIKQNGFSDSAMIGFYIFYNLVYALAAYPAGVLADKLGLKKIIVIGFLMFAVVYTVMGITHGFWVFAVIFFLYALYAAFTESIAKAWISNIADKEDTATAIGFLNSLSSICTMIASSLAGLIWVLYGPKVTFLFSGIGVALVAVYLVLFVKEKQESA